MTFERPSSSLAYVPDEGSFNAQEMSQFDETEITKAVKPTTSI